MGIPKFYSWIRKNYGNADFKKCPLKKVDWLCLDYNGLIYPVVHETLERYKILPDDIEDIIIKNIIIKTDELVVSFKPKKTFIAIDGVCPRAKMVQQRYRRFMSSLEVKRWDTNAITPGTKFMTKLNIELHQVYGDKHLISDSSEEGEGEHKIIKYISKLKGKNIIIMGLDADLMILSLKNSAINKVVIFKEASNCSSFLDISILRDLFITDFGINSLNDIVLLFNLLGNDFLPELKAVNDNGSMRCDKILNAYRKLKIKYPNFQIVDVKLNINVNALKEIFKYLLQLEKYQFPEEKHQKIYSEQEIYDIKDCMDEYYNGLSWIMNYYMKNEPCPSWSWFYKYRISPFMKDLIAYDIKIKPIKWYDDNAFEANHQLMLVLPMKSINLIQNEYLQDLIKNDVSKYYPIVAVLDKEHSEMASWHQKPFLPNFEEEYIKDLVDMFQ